MPWGPDDWDAWTFGKGETGIEPFTEDDPVARVLCGIPNRERLTVADLGCGRGAWIPFLATNYGRVVAIDYAPRSLAAAREIAAGFSVTLRRRDLRDLTPFRGRFHVALAVDSIVGPRPVDVLRILEQVHGTLVEGGMLVATLPAAPRRGRPVPLALGEDAARPGAILANEVEMQYRLRRVGFRGLKIRRLPPTPRSPERLLCVATRRANN